MSQVNEIDERKAFEDACYDYYLKRVAAGEVDTQDAGDGSREALFWRHHDGTYGVQMFNAAWFGWRERALLAKAPQPAQKPPRVGSGKTAEQTLAQWEHDLVNPPTPEQAEDFVRRERAFAAQQPAQKPTALCDCKGRFYDRCESAWLPCCVLGKSAEHAAVSNPNEHRVVVQRVDQPKTLNSTDVWILVERSGLGTYFAPRSDMQMRYESCVRKFAKMIEDEVLKKNELWPGSLIRATKPNVHMDGYVRTDRPNGDGL